MKLKLALVATVMQAALAVPFAEKPGADRDSLPGLLGLDPTEIFETSQTTSTSTSSKSQSTSVGGNIGPGGLFSSSDSNSKTKTLAAHSTSTATSTLDVQQMSSTRSASTSTSAATSTITATPTGSASSDSKTWKVVGVAVISMIAVALVVVCVIFWERGTRFVRKVLFGKKNSEGVEDFVPDWEKRSWEVKLGEDNHGYPVLPSDSFDGLARAPSALSHDDIEDEKRHPFPLRPCPIPVFVDFVSPEAQGTRPVENHSYSPMTTTELQRQNSRAAQRAYTACA
jgi:hypothetical protein